MSKGSKTQQEIDAFIEAPRLAILMYQGSRPAPTGVPVWFDWNGKVVRMFAGRTSPKVQALIKNPNISVLVTNSIGEPEGWVAFDGKVIINDFTQQSWSALLDQVAPRYWDLSEPTYAKEIESWHEIPSSFVSLQLTPENIRSGS